MIWPIVDHGTGKSAALFHFAHRVKFFTVIWTLLRVEGRFVRFQFGNQFLGPVHKGLVQDSCLYPAVPLDRLVDLIALIAHWLRPHSGGEQPGHLFEPVRISLGFVP
ncbi:MAG: hypothetical protein K2X57_06485 [Xanthobacteraceae bacterium]|nr:hypothetical protein [Xanthobacteraceae bacterium]